MKLIENAVYRLLEKKPFYAYFLLSSVIEYTDNSKKEGIPTAGVRMDKNGPKFVFNTDFVNTISPGGLAGIVEHEILHLLFQHTQVFKDTNYDKQLSNIAMDLAINQFIETLPAGTVQLDSAIKACGKPLLPLQTWEYYYLELLDKKGKLNGFTSVDSHDGLPEEMTDSQKASLSSALNNAVKACKGNIPAEVLKVYDAFNSQHKHDWRQMLRNFVSRSVSTSSKSTWTKLNRRWGLTQPGAKKKKS